MQRDRLKRRLQKKALRNTLLVLLGFILIGAFLFVFGQQLLIGFSLLLEKQGPESETTNEQSLTYVPAPDLDAIEEATNSARITITGYTSVQKAQIKLYVNSTLIDTVKTNSKSEFRFKNIELEKGTNEIKAKTVDENGKESDFSDSLSVIFSDKAPDLTVDYPQNGQTLKQEQQRLTGKTNPGSTVTVNGFRAIVDREGNFSYNVKLNGGGNTFKFIATDEAGNKTEKEISVTYSP